MEFLILISNAEKHTAHTAFKTSTLKSLISHYHTLPILVQRNYNLAS